MVIKVSIPGYIFSETCNVIARIHSVFKTTLFLFSGSLKFVDATTLGVAAQGTPAAFEPEDPSLPPPQVGLCKCYSLVNNSIAPKLNSAWLSLDSAQAGDLSARFGFAHANIWTAHIKQD